HVLDGIRPHAHGDGAGAYAHGDDWQPHAHDWRPHAHGVGAGAHAHGDDWHAHARLHANDHGQLWHFPGFGGQHVWADRSGVLGRWIDLVWVQRRREWVYDAG